MSRLSSDLRKLAEIEVRQVERLPVDIPSVLSEAFRMAHEQPGAAERSLNLSLPQAPWPLPTIQGDADLLLWQSTTCWQTLSSSAARETRWNYALLKMGRKLSSKLLTQVQASLMTNSRMFGRNFIAVKPGVVCRAVGWDWRLYVPLLTDTKVV